LYLILIKTLIVCVLVYFCGTQTFLSSSTTHQSSRSYYQVSTW